MRSLSRVNDPWISSHIPGARSRATFVISRIASASLPLAVCLPISLSAAVAVASLQGQRPISQIDRSTYIRVLVPAISNLCPMNCLNVHVMSAFSLPFHNFRCPVTFCFFRNVQNPLHQLRRVIWNVIYRYFPAGLYLFYFLLAVRISGPSNTIAVFTNTGLYVLWVTVNNNVH